jgi:hypothetical protein
MLLLFELELLDYLQQFLLQKILKNSFWKKIKIREQKFYFPGEKEQIFQI